MRATSPQAHSRATAKAAAMGWSLVGTPVEPAPGYGTPGRGNIAPGINGDLLPALSASRQLLTEEDAFTGWMYRSIVLVPPYQPAHLEALVEESDTLPTAIDALAVNISGFGWELEPTFPTKAETGEKIPPPPDAQEQEDRARDLLETGSIPDGLEGVLDAADRDIEKIGWGGFELLRNEDGDPAGFEYLPAKDLRFARACDLVLTEIPVPDRKTGEIRRLRKWRRFRAVAQATVDGRVVWFKQLGDPRHLNSQTGEFRAWTFARAEGSLTRSPDYGLPWGEDDEGRSLDATEVVIRVCQRRSGSPYGVPRWVGAAPHVLANREAAKLPYDFLRFAPIGVKIAMLAGGSWKAGQIKQIGEAFNSMGGRTRAFQVLALEAEQAGAGGEDAIGVEETSAQPPRMALEELGAKLDPDLYKGHDSLVGMTRRYQRQMFRLGPIYYGDSEAETNRAAADTARALGEEQVLRPIRASRWERLFNNEILPMMGITRWRFRLKGAPAANAEGLAAALAGLNAGGGTTPNGLARIVAELTGSQPYVYDEPWADRPFALTLALLQAGIDPNLPLDKAIAAMDAAKEKAAQQAKDLAAAKPAPEPPPPGEKPAAGEEEVPPEEPPPEKATKRFLDDIRRAAETVGLAGLKQAVESALRDGDVRSLPDDWRSRG